MKYIRPQLIKKISSQLHCGTGSSATGNVFYASQCVTGHEAQKGECNAGQTNFDSFLCGTGSRDLNSTYMTCRGGNAVALSSCGVGEHPA